MSDTPSAVMLFAAGLGTRMGALTATQPKPLIKVAGRALIDRALDVIEAAQVPRIVANLHHKPDMLAAHLAGRGIEFSYEIPDLLETGGGLRKALPLLGTGPVYTLNPDAVWTGSNPLNQLKSIWDPDKMDALLLLISPDQAMGYKGKGDFHLSTQGQITRAPGLVYSGTQIIKTGGLHAINKTAFSLNELWDQLIANGRIFGLLHQGGWCDVGHPAGIIAAEHLLQAQDV